MNTPTKLLAEEHQNILKIIDILLKECDGLKTDKEIDKDFFKKTIEFIRGYADKFHHAKEEDILFVELCKDTVQMHCNPTQQMLHEHDLGRDFVKNMEQGLRENNRDKIIENARGYARLLQEHIYKEDNILYPMADQALSQETKKAMLDKFEKVEQKFTLENRKHIAFVEALMKKMTNSSQKINELIEYPKKGILSKEVIKGDKLNITLFCMAKGTEISEHTSTKQGFVYVIEGKGNFNLAGQDIVMLGGVFIYMKENSVHSLRADKNTSFILVLVNV